jgi:hypothetical protein
LQRHALDAVLPAGDVESSGQLGHVQALASERYVPARQAEQDACTVYVQSAEVETALPEELAMRSVTVPDGGTV